MQEKNEGAISPQVTVDESQRQLREDGRHQDEGNGQTHPEVVVIFMVVAAKHGGAGELGAVQSRGDQDAPRGLNVTAVRNQHRAVLGARCWYLLSTVYNLVFRNFHCNKKV